MLVVAGDSLASVACSPLINRNGTVPEETAELVETIEKDVGPIDVAVYNIGAQVGSRTLEKTSYRIFNLALSMGAIGAFALAKELSPYMVARGKGTLIYTSSTAAYRGNAGQHAHTAAMGARRNLTQSISAELAPRGIHVCHVNVPITVQSGNLDLI